VVVGRSAQPGVQHALKYQSSLREDRRESLEGKIAFHLLQRWRGRKLPDRVPLKEGVASLKLELGDGVEVDPRTVGSTVRHLFSLSTDYRGGATWVLMGEGDAERLAARYTLPRDQWMRLVETEQIDAGR